MPVHVHAYLLSHTCLLLYMYTCICIIHVCPLFSLFVVRYSECANTLQSTKHDLQRVQKEHQEYKIKASGILQVHVHVIIKPSTDVYILYNLFIGTTCSN